MIIGGLDVGTTGSKIVLYDENCKLVDTYYFEYPAIHKDGQHEIDFTNIKNGVLSLLKEALKKYKIEAIGVTSFGESFVMVDENGDALAPAMMLTDSRGLEECEYLESIIGKEKIIEITGLEIKPMYSISKIMWLQKHRSDLYSKCKHILLGEDYIAFILTGKCMLEPSLASRTCAYDINTHTWSKQILQAASVDESLLSTPVDFGTIVGNIKDEVKKELNIDYDIQVVMACHDQIASLIGSGVFNNDVSMDGSGTVECIPVVMDKKPKDLKFYSYGYSATPFIDGKYACYAFSYTGGASLKWFKENFALYDEEISKQKNINTYEYLNSNCIEKPTEILVIPHFAGAATPYMDNDAKAAFVGVTLQHTRFDFYKALMEGNSYEMLVNIELLKEFTGEIKEIRATGGGATSDIWPQIKADVLNTNITCFDCKEVGAAGTAALTGRAIGVYDDLKETVSKMVPVRKTFTPNKDNVIKYQELFKKYKDLYPSLKKLGVE